MNYHFNEERNKDENKEAWTNIWVKPAYEKMNVYPSPACQKILLRSFEMHPHILTFM